jgi:hypothetical protein
MPELDQMNPEMEPQNEPSQVIGSEPGQVDQEGAMAKADLFKLANYSYKLFKKVNDNDQLEAWVQAKITKAADYIASVYHYLEYEMEFSEYGAKLENSEMYSESQKAVLKNKLMEAKEKIKALKVNQADKIKEGVIRGGHEESCTECGGTGMIKVPERAVPEAVKAKIEKYNRKAKAMHAASKRIDKNKNGIPDDEEFEEGFDEKSKEGDTFKTKTGVATKTDTGVKHTNTSYADDGEAEQKSGKGVKSHAKSQSASEKKEKAPAQKQSPKSAKTWGMKDSEKFDNRDGAPAKPKKEKEKEVDETYGQGVYEGKGKKPDFLDMDKDGDKKEPMKKAVADKKAGPKKGVNPFAKKDSKVEEALKGKQKKLDVDGDGDIEADDLSDLRAKKKPAKTESYVSKAIAEAKKKAAAGKKPDFLDMDKDGDKKEPMKKAVAEKEVVKESADLNRMKEFLTRLNG